MREYFLCSVKVESLAVVDHKGVFEVATMALLLAAVQWLPGQEDGACEDSIVSWHLIRALPVCPAATTPSVLLTVTLGHPDTALNTVVDDGHQLERQWE